MTQKYFAAVADATSLDDRHTQPARAALIQQWKHKYGDTPYQLSPWMPIDGGKWKMEITEGGSD